MEWNDLENAVSAGSEISPALNSNPSISAMVHSVDVRWFHCFSLYFLIQKEDFLMSVYINQM